MDLEFGIFLLVGLLEHPPFYLQVLCEIDRSADKSNSEIGIRIESVEIENKILIRVFPNPADELLHTNAVSQDTMIQNCTLPLVSRNASRNVAPWFANTALRKKKKITACIPPLLPRCSSSDTHRRRSVSIGL